MSQVTGLAFAMLSRERVWKTIERIWRGEGDVAPKGDGVARAFSHDLNVLIHLLSPEAIVGTGRMVKWR